MSSLRMGDDECGGCPLESHNHYPTITQELVDVLDDGRVTDIARARATRPRTVGSDRDTLEAAFAVASRRQEQAPHGSGYGDNKGTWGALQDTLRDALNLFAGAVRR